MVGLINLLIILYCLGAAHTACHHIKMLDLIELPHPPMKDQFFIGLMWWLVWIRFWQYKRRMKK